ncbi:MAG: multidrug effflux MFS transporter [Gemmatimonadetes bacterium]|nr:multidrug effflux MFS transporter [Gemmatimonadota bacterium]MYE69438.1 multidrug effflux MFS transporter [Gemmatimonadota bacterium]MYJ67948.1 multidrug effflux MFS transporter [Gemmatimonadota bacterium]
MEPESMDTGDLETAPAARSTVGPPPRTVPAVLVMLTMLVPLAINLYLPALPEIAAVFGVGVPRIQTSLGVFLLGLAVGQFGGAPIADRYGRRATALSGTGIFAAATVGVLLSASADQFIALRAVQGVGAGVAFVNVGAVVGDLFDHQAGARMLSAISAMQAVPRLIGPACGAALAMAFGWRSTFQALLAYCVVLGCALWFWLPETVARPAESQRPPLVRSAIQGYRQVFGRAPALGYVFCLGFSTACLLVYVNDGAFIYTVWFGLSPGHFSGFLAANVVALVLGTLLNFRLLRKHGAHRIAGGACAVQCLAAFGLLAHVTLMTPAFSVVAVLLMVSSGVLGLIVGNAAACFLKYFRGIRGTASGVAGTLQFLLGGAVGTGLSVVHTGTLATTAIASSLCASLALLSLVRARPLLDSE